MKVDRFSVGWKQIFGQNVVSILGQTFEIAVAVDENSIKFALL